MVRRIIVIAAVVVAVFPLASSAVAEEIPAETDDGSTTTVTVAAEALLGSLRIEQIGLDVPLFDGISADTLSNGVGHYPSTPLPGVIGNMGIAGHRAVEAAPFARLHEVSVDSPVVVTIGATPTRYVVVENTVLPVDDPAILAASDDQRLTLTAAEGDGSTQRVVRAVAPGGSVPSGQDVLAGQTDTGIAVPGSSSTDPGTSGVLVFVLVALIGAGACTVAVARR